MRFRSRPPTLLLPRPANKQETKRALNQSCGHLRLLQQMKMRGQKGAGAGEEGGTTDIAGPCGPPVTGALCRGTALAQGAPTSCATLGMHAWVPHSRTSYRRAALLLPPAAWQPARGGPAVEVSHQFSRPPPCGCPHPRSPPGPAGRRLQVVREEGRGAAVSKPGEMGMQTPAKLLIHRSSDGG